MQVKIIENSKKFLALGATMVLISLAVILTKGLNYGIDFSGGNLIQIKYEKTVTLNQVNNLLDTMEKNIPQLSPNSRKVQISEGKTVIIRTQELSENQKNEVLTNLNKIGKYNIDKIDKVGASVGKELKTSAIYSLLIGGVLIIIYITVRFEFIFSIGAIVALIHDITIALGAIAFLGYEINTPFIAAILTILGYSINDTIVVFDRIRENIRRQKDLENIDFETCLNKSINQVMVRSINTSVTTLFAILAILIFGGDSLRTFIVTLLVGILAGTYSSIFIATPIVYLLNKRKKNKNGGLYAIVEKEENNETKEKILV